MEQEEIMQMDKLVPSAEKHYVYVLRKIVSGIVARFIHKIRSSRSQFCGKCSVSPRNAARAGLDR
jgi:hypothetical protein